MLDMEILEVNHGVSYGSVTLKSLQNDNVPDIDLLVREAIQNSSDASLGQPEDSFTVNFNSGKFCPAEFNSYLTEVEEELNFRYPVTDSDFLEIRDKQTSGLTGCIRIKDLKKDDHGNFFKLIYDTGKKQTQKNAGGNWGFGKSVYYRVGIGIVVFYSRVRVDDGYESRLIITLVEDEGKDDAVLSTLSDRSAGKAWWGIREGEDLLPVTDDEFINPVLSVFGLKPFKNEETGTSIIIPYIDSKKLLDNIIPAEAAVSEDIRARCTWAYDFEQYLTLAIQKWYAPKIQNRNLRDFCSKKWLRVYVNNKPIRYDEMLPFFRMVQELYTIAIAKTYNFNYSCEWLSDAVCMDVSVRNYFDTEIGNAVAGHVAAIKISKEDLNCGQNLLPPYIYIRHFENDNKNEPIVMFARDPGMVVDYPITGPWVKNITPPDSLDDYIFAFFVPITEKKLKRSVPEYAGKELGEYLRACEASDHKEWNDLAKMQLVERIQKNTVNKICSKICSSPTVPIEATASKLSGKLGRKLLPRVGYGKSKGKSGGGEGVGKLNNIDFKIMSQRISQSELAIDYSLKLSFGKRNAEISIIIDSEGGWIDPESWNNDIGTPFPIRIKSISIADISSNIDIGSTEVEWLCTSDNPSIDNEKIAVSLEKINDTEGFTKIKVISHIINPKIVGTLKLKTYDKKYRFSFKTM